MPRFRRYALALLPAAALTASAHKASADVIFTGKTAPWNTGAPYNWSGFYAGGHIGLATGASNWNAGPGVSGNTSFYQGLDSFNEGGSFFEGVQAGYNHLLPNRVLIGAEVDASAPAWATLPTGVNPFGVSIGGSSNFNSPALGAASLAETVVVSGTARARIGYAPGHWLFYATGGFAWSYDQQSVTQISTGNSDTPFLWRLGWAAGAGVEVPVVPHWTARFEYLFTDYGRTTTNFLGGVQSISSDIALSQFRAGLSYQFNEPAAPVPFLVKAPTGADPDIVNFHGQFTAVEQANAAFRSSSVTGANSLPSVANARETTDLTLYAGLRLWQGAEFWVNPEIDQGHGLADTHGIAGFPSGESYKLGDDYPYARLQRYFVRQTIDLGGGDDKVDADINQFAGPQANNRLVLTVGKFSVVDIFDTNKYSNNPKSDFMNWSLINAATFDYAGDAWGYSYGAAAEWYQGRFTLRGGVFDMSAVPAMAANSVTAYGLDNTFSQQQFLGEFEERHELWGQAGTFKVTGFVIHGRMGDFADAVALAQPGQAFAGDPSTAIASLRIYRYKPGVSINLAQQVSETVGVFARAGWSDGRYEIWDFTDVDRTVQAGIVIGGKNWSRPEDTIGIAGVINGLDPVHQAYFAAGGTGVLIGDGGLANYGVEQIIEAYYSYAINSWSKVSIDYQFVANPGYNADRGPVSIFAGRFHAGF
jgi:high affinity Mn2+ porin